MRNAMLDESQAGIKIAGRNINNLRYAHCLKSLLMTVKEEHDNVSLKLYTQKTKITDSGPMANRRGKSVEAVTFYFPGLQNHLDSDCSHKIKRCLFLGRKAVTNLDKVLKIRDTTLPTKFCIVKPVVFSAVMYRHESWTKKKGEP